MYGIVFGMVGVPGVFGPGLSLGEIIGLVVPVGELLVRGSGVPFGLATGDLGDF